MPDFFVLDCMPEIGTLHWNLDVSYPSSHLRWVAGVAFSESDARERLRPPQEPIVVRTVLDDEYMPRRYPELTWEPIPLVSRPLLTALQAAGVDNLQVFSTRLLDRQGSNPPPEDHYVAINIIGLVAAADLERSQAGPGSEAMVSKDFVSLSVDSEAASQFLLFRLAENVSAVLAHQRVRRSVEAAGIDTLTWHEPEYWAG